MKIPKKVLLSLAALFIISGFFVAPPNASAAISFVKNIGTTTKSSSSNANILVTVPASGFSGK